MAGVLGRAAGAAVVLAWAVAGPAGAQEVRRSFQDCSQCPEMVVVPAGSFLMGSPSSEQGRTRDEGPQHHVTIARDFAVGMHEVTFAQWDACVAAGSSTTYRAKS